MLSKRAGIAGLFALVLVLGLSWLLLGRGGAGGSVGSPKVVKPDAIELADQNIVVGMRSGKPVAMIDLIDHAYVLSRLTEAEVDGLVRQAVLAKSRQWFAQENLKSSTHIAVDVLTLTKRDEYARPDFKSAVRHGQLVVQRPGAAPAAEPAKDGTTKVAAPALEGKLTFEQLRKRQAEFKPPAASRGDGVTRASARPIAPAQKVPVATPEQIAAAKEHILFDEVDLWHHPRVMSNIYPNFDPLRVRPNNSEYYFRNDSQGPRFAASGSRYGEIQLTGERGSLTYMPRRLDFVGTLAFSVMVRKSNPAARIAITIHQDFTRAARIEEGKSPLLPPLTGTEWTRVVLPLHLLEFKAVERVLPKTRSWTEPEEFLAHYSHESGYVFGIELGLEGAVKGDRLYFDKLASLRADQRRREPIIAGRLVQAAPGAKVVAKGRGFETSVEPDAEGNFEIQLPAAIRIVEIHAEVGKYHYAPRTGRFLEIGSYIPDIEIPTIAERGTDYPFDTSFNSSFSRYDKEQGPYYFAPNRHFGVARGVAKQPVALFVEQRLNARGFVDRDRRADNPDKAYRVVLIGDSHVLGFYNEATDSLWNQTEARLNMLLDRPVEVISAVHHFSPLINSWSQFRSYVLGLKPDLVLISVPHPEVFNYAMQDYMREYLSSAPGKPTATMFELDKAGKLVLVDNDPDWEANRIPLTAEERAGIRARSDTTQYWRKDLENAPKWLQDNLKTIELALRFFAEEGKKHGIEIGLAYTSAMGHLRTQVYRKDNVDFDESLVRPRTEALAKQAGIMFVDISTAMFADAPDPDLYLLPDSHWSAYAHYRATQPLVDFVSQKITAAIPGARKRP